MAGGSKRQPIDLIIAKGKKHLTKEEIQERKDQEIKVGFVDIKPPKHLTKKQKAEFKEIAYKLKAIGIMTELDEELLARYILSKDQYLFYTKSISQAIEENDMVQCNLLSNLQDKSFKQCRACATDLGLTISSRCKLVVPKVETEAPKSKFDKFRKN